MKIAVTGHRPENLGKEYNMDGPVSTSIKEELRKVITKARPTEMITGMALGVDMIWATLAIEMNIPLVAAIPFIGQENRWPKTSRELYHKILSSPNVTQHVICEGGYDASKMHIRNRWMVDRSNMLVAVWDGSEGGTGSCVKYAKSIEKEIQRINPTAFVAAKEQEMNISF